METKFVQSQNEMVQSLVPILSHINPNHTLISYFSSIHFNIIPQTIKILIYNYVNVQPYNQRRTKKQMITLKGYYMAYILPGKNFMTSGS